MAPSIVISNMTIRFGHQATIGILPVGSGQASCVIRVSHVAIRNPTRAPPLAMYHSHVFLPILLNSYSSNGSALMTVMSRSATPAARKPMTARSADAPSAYSAYKALMLMRASPPGDAREPRSDTVQAQDARLLSAPR